MATLTFHVDSVEQEDAWPIAVKMFDIIDPYLQPGSTWSAQDTAEKLQMLRPDVRSEADNNGEKKESLETFVWNFWVLFAETAREIPYDHPSQERMLKLAFALRDIADSPRGSGWKGPGHTLHEWIDIDPFDPHSTDPGNLVRKARVHNLYTFVARLTEAQYGDYSCAAVWSLSAALEDIPDPRAKAWHTHGPVLDAWVPIAAEWIRHTGDIILQKCRDGVETSGQPFPNKNNGRKGFFMDRWQFWKDKFGELSSMDQPSPQTKAIAEYAHTRMTELEKSAAQ